MPSLPLRTRLTHCALLCAAAFVPVRLLAQQRDTSRTPYTPYAPGVLSATHFTTDSLPSYRIEVRDLLIGPRGEASDIPVPGFALMEVRAGAIDLSLNDTRSQRDLGNYWIVPRGVRVAIRNLGELAVIRVVFFTPR